MSQFVPPPPPSGVVVPLPTATPAPVAPPQEVTTKASSVAFDIDIGGFGKARAGSPKPAPNFSFLRREPANKLTRTNSGSQLDALRKEKQKTTSPLSLSLTAGKSDKKETTLSVLKSLDSNVGLVSAHPTLNFAQVTGVALKPSALRASVDTFSSSVAVNAATNGSVRTSSGNMVDSLAQSTGPVAAMSPGAPAGLPSAPTAPPTPSTATSAQQSVMPPVSTVPLPSSTLSAAGSTPYTVMPTLPTLAVATTSLDQPQGTTTTLPAPMPAPIPALGALGAPAPLSGSTVLTNNLGLPPATTLQSSTLGPAPNPSAEPPVPVAPPAPSAADLASMVPLTGALLEKALDAFQSGAANMNSVANPFYYPYHRLGNCSENLSDGGMGAFTTTAISLLAPTSQFAPPQQNVLDQRYQGSTQWDAAFTVNQEGRAREYNPALGSDWRLNPVCKTGYTSSTMYHATNTQSREYCRGAASIAQSRYAERAARYTTSTASMSDATVPLVGHGSEPSAATDRMALPPAPPAVTASSAVHTSAVTLERSVSPATNSVLGSSTVQPQTSITTIASEGQGATKEVTPKNTFSVVSDPRSWKLRVANDSPTTRNAGYPFPSLAPEHRPSGSVDYPRAETVFVYSNNNGNQGEHARNITTSALLSEPLLKSSVMHPIHATSTDIWNAALQAAEQQCKEGADQEKIGGDGGGGSGESTVSGDAKAKSALHTGLVDRLRVLWGTKVVDERVGVDDGADQTSDDAPSLRTRVRLPGKSEPVVPALSPSAQLLAAALLYARGEGHFPRLLSIHRLTVSGSSSSEVSVLENRRVRPEECLELKFLKPDVHLRVASEALEREAAERTESAGLITGDIGTALGTRAQDRRTTSSGMSRKSLYSRRGSVRSEGGVAGFKAMLTERREKTYGDSLPTQSGVVSNGMTPAIRSDEDVISVVVRAIVADRHVLHDAGRQVVVHTLPHLQDDEKTLMGDASADNNGGNGLKRTAPTLVSRRRTPRDRIPVLSPTDPSGVAEVSSGSDKTVAGTLAPRIANELSTYNRFGDLSIVFVLPRGKSQLTAMPPTPTELAMLRYGIFSLQGYDPLSRVPITSVTNKSTTAEKNPLKKEKEDTPINDFYSTLVTRDGGKLMSRKCDSAARGSPFADPRLITNPVPVGSTFADARDVAGMTCASRDRNGGTTSQQGLASRRMRASSLVNRRESVVLRAAQGNSSESAFENFLSSARNASGSVPKPATVPPYVPQNISEETLQRYLREEAEALKARSRKPSERIKVKAGAGSVEPRLLSRASSSKGVRRGGERGGVPTRRESSTRAPKSEAATVNENDEVCNATFRPSDVKQQPKLPSRKPSCGSINVQTNRASSSAGVQKPTTRVQPATRSSSRISLFSDPLQSFISTETSESGEVGEQANIQQRASSHDTRPPRPPSRMLSREASVASIAQASGVFENSVLNDGRSRLNKPVSRHGSFSLDLGSISRSLRPVSTFGGQTAAQEAAESQYGGEQYQSAIFGMPITQAPVGSGIFYNMSATQTALPQPPQKHRDASQKTKEKHAVRSTGAAAALKGSGEVLTTTPTSDAHLDVRPPSSSSSSCSSFPFHMVDFKLFARELQASADSSFYERVDPLASITAKASYRL